MQPFSDFEWTGRAETAAALAELIERAPPSLRGKLDQNRAPAVRVRAIELLCLLADESSVPVLRSVVTNQSDDHGARECCLRKLVHLGAALSPADVESLFQVDLPGRLETRYLVVLAERAGMREIALAALREDTPPQRARCLQALSHHRIPETEPYRDWLYAQWLAKDRQLLEGGEPLNWRVKVPLNGAVALATAEYQQSRRILGEYLPNGPIGWVEGYDGGLRESRPEVWEALVKELGWIDHLAERLKLPGTFLAEHLGQEPYEDRLRQILAPYVCCRPRELSPDSVPLAICTRAEGLVKELGPEGAARVLIPLLQQSFGLLWAQTALRTLWDRNEAAAVELVRRSLGGDAPSWIPGAVLELGRGALSERHGWLIDWGLSQSEREIRTAAMLWHLRLRRGLPTVGGNQEGATRVDRLLGLALRAQDGDRKAETELVKSALKAHPWERSASLALLAVIDLARYRDVFQRMLLEPFPSDAVPTVREPTEMAGYYLSRLDDPVAWTSLLRFALGTKDQDEWWAARQDLEDVFVRAGWAEPSLPISIRIPLPPSSRSALGLLNRLEKAGKL